MLHKYIIIHNPLQAESQRRIYSLLGKGIIAEVQSFHHNLIAIPSTPQKKNPTHNEKRSKGDSILLFELPYSKPLLCFTLFYK